MKTLLLLLLMCAIPAYAAPAKKADVREMKRELRQVDRKLRIKLQRLQEFVERGVRELSELESKVEEQRLDILSLQQERDVYYNTSYSIDPNGFVSDVLSCGEGNKLIRYGWDKAPDVDIRMLLPDAVAGFSPARPSELRMLAVNRGADNAFLTIDIWCELRP